MALSYSSVAVTLPILRISTGAITGIQLLFSSVFFKPDPVGFEAGRHRGRPFPSGLL